MTIQGNEFDVTDMMNLSVTGPTTISEITHSLETWFIDIHVSKPFVLATEYEILINGRR